MNKKVTQDQLFRDKLAETSVPHWKEGWDRMLPVLDDSVNKPSSITLTRLKPLCAAAAIALLLVSFSVWWLWKKSAVQPDQQRISIVPSRPASVMEQPFSVRKRDTFLVSKPSALPVASETVVRKVLTGEAEQPQHALSVSDMKKDENLPVLQGRFTTVHLPSAWGRNHTVIPVSVNQGEKLPALSSIVVKREKQLIPLTQPEAAGKQTSGLHFAVRLNANGGSSFGNAASNYSPVLKGTPVDVYPSVYVSKELSLKFSLQAGLAVASPVNVQKEGLSRSVSNPLRAMAANVPQSQDSMNLNRLYYADIPITVQYHLNKKISIGSGLQLSVLEKIIGEKQRLDYNNYGIVAMTMPDHPRPENLTRTAPASGTISPVDLRWVLGLHYQLGKHWNATLQYQYGLTDISSDHAFLNNHVNRNNVLRAGIGFVIK